MTSASLLSKLASSQNLRKLTSNAGWLVAERIVTMTVNIAVSVWLARYLGPAGFGMLSYAIALVALVEFLPYFGLDSLVVRHLVETPEKRGELLGTTVTLRLLGGIIAAACVLAFAVFSSGDQTTRLMISIIAIGLVLDSSGVFDIWFQSKLQSRLAVQARTGAVLAVAALRVSLIMAEAPLYAFAIAVVVQKALQAVALGLMFLRNSGGGARWNWSSSRAVSLLRQSWPLLLASAGSLIYLKIDQVMLGQMAGSEQVGVYAVAVRWSEIWWFLPTALAGSLMPILVKSRMGTGPAYDRQLQKALIVMFWLGVAIAIPVTLVAAPLIIFLYGNEYAGAVDMLQIHVWSCPVMFMGAVFSRWIVIENLQIFSLTRSLAGAALNVGLNLLLIPSYGGVGAAIATLVSYSASTYFACFLDRRSFKLGVMMTRAIFAPLLLITARAK